MAQRGGALVVDAIFNLAAHGHLHCLCHRHGSQTARTAGQLRQPVRPLLGPGVQPEQPEHGLQRLVVFTDSGFSGLEHQLVHQP